MVGEEPPPLTALWDCPSGSSRKVQTHSRTSDVHGPNKETSSSEWEKLKPQDHKTLLQSKRSMPADPASRERHSRFASYVCQHQAAHPPRETREPKRLLGVPRACEIPARPGIVPPLFFKLHLPKIPPRPSLSGGQEARPGRDFGSALMVAPAACGTKHDAEAFAMNEICQATAAQRWPSGRWGYWMDGKGPAKHRQDSQHRAFDIVRPQDIHQKRHTAMQAEARS